jgi:hypothetical protein
MTSDLRRCLFLIPPIIAEIQNVTVSLLLGVLQRMLPIVNPQVVEPVRVPKLKSIGKAWN